MTVSTRKPASRRLRLDPELSKAKRLAACKKYLKSETEHIVTRNRAGDSGIKVARLRSNVIDNILIELCVLPVQVHKDTYGETDIPVTLIALGGYGRAELSPFSDIDIMFLYPVGIKPK